MRPVLLLVLACALGIAACGGDTETATVTETESSAAPEPKPEPVVPSLGTDRRKPGEIVIVSEGAESHGPRRFRNSIYTVRFEQFAPDQPGLDFRSESSSFVVQLHRKPGVIDSGTVHLFNATLDKGRTQVTIPGGEFYGDVSSADHSYALRFTPQ